MSILNCNVIDNYLFMVYILIIKDMVGMNENLPPPARRHSMTNRELIRSTERKIEEARENVTWAKKMVIKDKHYKSELKKAVAILEKYEQKLADIRSKLTDEDYID